MFTTFLIAILIFAGAVTALGGGVALLQRRKRLGQSDPQKSLPGSSGPALLERGIGDLRINDVVLYDGRDFLVEGRIAYEEAGHRWSMSRMVDGRDTYWLLDGLERSGTGSRCLLKTTDAIRLSEYPPNVLFVDEQRYTFAKRGTATAKLRGNTGSLGGTGGDGSGLAHRCRFWTYDAPGTGVLLVEQWGDDYRVLVGHGVSDGDLDMMPGS